MNDDRLQEAIAAATAYEELHVPALFSEWTSRVLDAAEVRAGHRVLDVACGTGILARAAAKRVGSPTNVVGVDASAGMLAVAGRLDGDIDWRQGGAESLPCADAGFDRVVSQFGMMFFADRERAASEMLRVLIPGGRLAIAVWDSLENAPAYAMEVDLFERMAGPAAADALRAPFVMGDRSELHRLVEGAGATAVECTTTIGRANFPSIRSMVEADLRGWLPVMGVDLSEELILAILSEAEIVLADFRTTDGRMQFDSPAHIVAAKKPSDTR